ncbi:MAG TPA: hypothetical protein VES59_07595 [Bacteroidota bacterium]|nr:hypothetical protein [Bacteroidota bacterium]
MGFSGIPPRADLNVAIASINLWSQRADAAIMSYELPWDSLLAGVPAETIAVRELLLLANYYRAKGHQLWVYIDPANGLNRAGESDGLVRHGRSITEPAIQQIFRRYVVVVDSVRAVAVFQLTFTDLDLSASPPPPGSILPLFAHLGLVDVNLTPKPALGAWDAAFYRPRHAGIVIPNPSAHVQN